MSWLDKFTGAKSPPAASEGDRAQEAASARGAQWESALKADRPPDFVIDRLRAVGSGKTPWVATMTPVELHLARSHGLRPLSTVSGTCWYRFGWSLTEGRKWTEGHAAGWAAALDRIRQEAIAAGANAVVDVQMRTIRQGLGDSMDFTLVGTAVKIEGLPPSPDPVIATVPALEFVRLVESGIVPVGLAVGASFDTLDGLYFQQPNVFMGNLPLTTLGQFWERVRRNAHARLRESAAAQGGSVLAHVQFGQLLARERDKQPPIYLGRHIVIGTVVDTPAGEGVKGDIHTVVDMRDGASPLTMGTPSRHSAYGEFHEHEGAI